MNYRHAYHAGNVADVFKHFVLCETLHALHAKPTPFCVVDTHAGGGLYALKAPGEFERGIGELWRERAQWPALARYFEVVAAHNGDALTQYPGSPLFIRAFLRAQDRAVLCELHPEEHAALRECIRDEPRIAVHKQDAWNALKAFIPPRENRGLVLIDPPYEQPDEFKRIARGLAQALTHWRNGMYLVWYPIKAYRPIEDFHDRLRTLGAPMYCAELLTSPLDVGTRLNGSGLILVNPPWTLPDYLKETLPALARRLAGATGAPQGRVRKL